MLLSFHLTNPKGFISEPKCVCSLRCCCTSPPPVIPSSKRSNTTCFVFSSLISLVPYALTVNLYVCTEYKHFAFTGVTYAKHTRTKRERETYVSIEAIWIPSEFWFLNAIYRCMCFYEWERGKIVRKKLCQTGDGVEMKNTVFNSKTVYTLHIFLFIILIFDVHMHPSYMSHTNADYSRSLAEEFPFIQTFFFHFHY